MQDFETKSLSFDAYDELHNPRPAEQDFDRVVASALSRRGFLTRVLAFGSGAAVMGLGNMLSSTSALAQATTRFGKAFAQHDFTTTQG